MVRLNYGGLIYEAAAASKSETDIWLYDSSWYITEHISGISSEEWSYIVLEEGEWTDPSDVPSPDDISQREIERLRAEVAYLKSLDKIELVGELSETCSMVGYLSVYEEEPEEVLQELVGELSLPKEIYDEEYRGPYDTTPTSGFQLLLTDNKHMVDNVIVYPIPYTEVSNPKGGYTATIG